MLNQYETVFICTPVLSEPQVKEAVKKFRDIIAENGGDMIHEENWGMKKLAYPIQKKSTGFFHLFEFIETCLKYLDDAQENYINLHIYFLIDVMLRF